MTDRFNRLILTTKSGVIPGERCDRDFDRYYGATCNLVGDHDLSAYWTRQWKWEEGISYWL